MPKPIHTNKQAKATRDSSPPADAPGSRTPPASPTREAVEPQVTLTVKDLTHALVEALRAHGTIPSTQTQAPVEPRSDGRAGPKRETQRASKLAFKTVDEIWDTTSSMYKVVSSVSAPELDELDENVFVARRRVDKDTKESTCFVDVKSEGLRDVLRAIFENVRGTSLKEEQPTIEQKLLYHFVPELEARAHTEGDSILQKQILLLTDHIKKSYTFVRTQIRSLVAVNREITFNLLWALFKPNDIVYGECFGTIKPRCVVFESGDVKILEDGTAYFHIRGRYLDYNGRDFGEASTALGIIEFRGAKRIDNLEAFPLQYHPRAEAVKRKLMDCGRKFQALMGSHHREYKGVAFFQGKRDIDRATICGRIVVDAALFFEIKPNYTKPRFDKQGGSNSVNIWGYSAEPDKIRKRSPEPAELSDDLLLVCSPTVLGFSFSTKQWLEFAVSDIRDIEWNPESFERLTIPEKQKKLIQAVATSHINREASSFDDFVRGKGQGLVVLLHGPPGVGKTLTAEGLSEYLEKPLYAVSSAEISADAKEAEAQLFRIFRQAEEWRAVLLLDEADVFLRRRSLDHVRDTHITMFLRMLEYYRGILFLTTNRVNDFDEAMQSRVDLPLRYSGLSQDTRKTIWRNFLAQCASPVVDEAHIEKLAAKQLNGRQIKNAVKLAHEWVSKEETPLTYSHLNTVLEMYCDFERVVVGHGSIENQNSYT